MRRRYKLSARNRTLVVVVAIVVVVLVGVLVAVGRALGTSKTAKSYDADDYEDETVFYEGDDDFALIDEF